MKVLLDTHALLWTVLYPHRVSSKAQIIVADEANDIFVSAASAWEIATKVRIGKLPEAAILESRFFEVLDTAGYKLLAIEPADALRAGRLVGSHGDPFDRMIAAQAIAGDLLVLSNDAKLDLFGVRRLW